MMGILSSLSRCLSPAKKYSLIIDLKKEDDLGQEIVRQWILAHPVSPDIASWDTKKIEKHVEQLFKALPSYEVCSANIPEVKTHLLAMAKSCQRAERATFQEWLKVPFRNKFKEEIGEPLALASARLC